MSNDPLTKVTLSNGVSRTPLGSKSDSPRAAAVYAVIDLMLCLRQKRPNLNLGGADRFIGVGESGLALLEIEAVLESELPFGGFAEAAYRRACELLPKDERGLRR
ncbi:MAG: hypothetical protein HKN18_12995 [Silicimonas sp.]|nr:hypothetical protein [Silicimonas sp.]